MNTSKEELVADLFRVVTLLRKSFDREMLACGASLAQTKVLMCIKGMPGTARAADIAEALGISPRTVTEALDGLEREGRIVRAADPDDRRVKRLTITSAGEEALGLTQPLRRKLSEQVVEALEPSEQRQFHAALRKILERLPTG
ncbi:MarR family winged helix-turn-helix transcriptional regulator [Sphingobium sp. EM0848]|uniref:MarR family winged helix-turn-helix transcriptional regulator n=1 Tax=Sphingobium sp. EM0848 TaxID=2743473 RepID=UPI00159CBD67|nr:MarR family winged helix-turn-helix transcriptional regulator [Sphingobium sp. EM0848]